MAKASSITKAGKIRLSLDVTKDEYDEFEQAVSLDSSRTLIGMIRNAVKLLKATRLLEKREGKIIFREKDGTEERIVLL